MALIVFVVGSCFYLLNIFNSSFSLSSNGDINIISYLTLVVLIATTVIAGMALRSWRRQKKHEIAERGVEYTQDFILFFVNERLYCTSEPVAKWKDERGVLSPYSKYLAFSRLIKMQLKDDILSSLVNDLHKLYTIDFLKLRDEYYAYRIDGKVHDDIPMRAKDLKLLCEFDSNDELNEKVKSITVKINKRFELHLS